MATYSIEIGLKNFCLFADYSMISITGTILCSLLFEKCRLHSAETGKIADSIPQNSNKLWTPFRKSSPFFILPENFYGELSF